MLSRFITSFRAAAPRPLPEPDAKLALGALLVHAAMSDHRYEVSEIKRIDRILARLYGLGPIEAAKMRATCERLHAAFPETETFSALIRRDLPPEARRDAFAALWQVVLADGDERSEEAALIAQIQAELGLSAAEAELARRQAQTD